MGQIPFCLRLNFPLSPVCLPRDLRFALVLNSMSWSTQSWKACTLRWFLGIENILAATVSTTVVGSTSVLSLPMDLSLYLDLDLTVPWKAHLCIPGMLMFFFLSFDLEFRK